MNVKLNIGICKGTYIVVLRSQTNTQPTSLNRGGFFNLHKCQYKVDVSEPTKKDVKRLAHIENSIRIVNPCSVPNLTTWSSGIFLNVLEQLKLSSLIKAYT